ncbi:MAG: DUF3240 family protein [Pseudomonadales bacterium]
MKEFEHVLVVITTAPTLEEPLIDWLLAREHQTGFTSMPVFGHSSRHDHLSPAEQVSGRQRRLQFQIQLAVAHTEQFLRELREEFEGADLHFWIQPLYTPSE